MYFHSSEKDLVVRGLEYVKSDLAKSRDLFDIGSLEREVLEKKFSQVVDLKNNPNKSSGITPSDKKLIVEGLIRVRVELAKNCDLFPIGTIEREALDEKLSQVSVLIGSLT